MNQENNNSLSLQDSMPSEQQMRLTIDGCAVNLNFLSKTTAADNPKIEAVKRMILSGLTGGQSVSSHL